MISTASLKSFYSALPKWARAPFGVLPQPFVLKRSYRDECKVLASWRSGALDVGQIQRVRLAEVLTFALKHVPYYREMNCASSMLASVSHDPFEVLAKFPLVKRADLDAHGDKFEVDGVRIPGGVYTTTTGGTSGPPIVLRHSNDSFGSEWAFVMSYLAEFGVGTSDRRISLRGVRFSNARSAIEWNPTYRELRVSPFHISKSTAKDLAVEIRRFKPAYIHGYPSSIAQLLDVLGPSAGDVLKDVRVVLAVSEDLSITFIQRVRALLGVPVASFYGMSERVCFIEHDPGLGLWTPNPLYGVTEFLDGQIIGTGFTNFAQVLIRYETGDQATFNEKGDVVGIHGRWNHTQLVAKDGMKVSMTALNLHSDAYANVSEFQLVQDAPGVVDVLFNDASVVSSGHAERLCGEFTNKCSGSIEFAPKLVRSFEMTSLGKRPLVVVRKGLSGD